jgi:plastocyanin
MRRFPLIALGAAALALVGCGSSGSSSGSGSTGASAPASAPTAPTGASGLHVVMKDLAFSPKATKAKIGQTITWTNQDQVAHNVSYVSGPKFKSSGTLGDGRTFSLKLTQAGVTHYVCTIHPFMTATIVVSK